MRTAIDTNVLSALWSKEPLASDMARNLGNAKREAGVVVSARVYAELLAYPKATESFVNDLLADPQWSGQKRPTVVRSKPANGCGPGLRCFTLSFAY